MEARRSYRIELNTELTLTHDRKEMRGTVINVGLSGVLVKISAPLTKDDMYWVTFQLKPERTQFKSWAKVAWIQEHDSETYLVGLQFDRIDSGIYRTLADYISERWISEHLSPGSFGGSRF